MSGNRPLRPVVVMSNLCQTRMRYALVGPSNFEPMEAPSWAAWAIGPPVRWDAEGQPEGFINRKTEFEALRRGFQSDGRVGLISGPAGMGKTALAQVFASTSQGRFLGGVETVWAIDADQLGDLLLGPLTLPLETPTLLVLEEADLVPIDDVHRVTQILEENKLLSLLVVSRTPEGWSDFADFHVRLGGLEASEFADVLGSAALKDPAGTARLFALADGHPLVARVTSDLVSDSSTALSLKDIINDLGGFRRQGVTGPTGVQLPVPSSVLNEIALEVRDVNDHLLRDLRKDPEKLVRLHPRQFEQVVAELLSKQGFRVELTPASGDGGFDIYAARKDSVGTFLYLVECKRYTPPNKVGVEVVRSLHGVVQLNRATAGVVATTSRFTRGAQEFQSKVEHQMSLVDYIGLHQWLKQL